MAIVMTENSNTPENVITSVTIPAPPSQALKDAAKPKTSKPKMTLPEQILAENNPAKKKLLELKLAATQAAEEVKNQEAIARQVAKEEQAKAKAKAKAEKQAAKPVKVPIAAIPVPEPVAINPINQQTLKTLTEGKASSALKAAWSADNNAELGYKQLAERYGFSIVGLVEDLVIEKVWPREPEGSKREGLPVSYKKLYNIERDNGIKSWGHMVNRASERFAMVNPENIKAREEEKARKAEEKKEQAALEAAGLAKKAKSASVPVDKALDVSKLEAIDLFNLAKACILAMDENMRDLLALDGEVKEALKITE